MTEIPFKFGFTSPAHEAEEFSRALARHPTHRRPIWADIVSGVALAFDPLPAKRPSKFCLCDRAAFNSDLAKLIADRSVIEPSLMGRGSECIQQQLLGRVETVNGQTSDTCCEAD